MELGIMFANTGRFAGAQGARELGPAAEAAGFESVWTVEHVLYPEGYESTYPYSPTGKMPGTAESPIPDPLVWLAFIAATTTTLKLATGILILPLRSPAVTAKACSTLDQLSEGRHLLGIGSGWLKEEFDAMGIPFERRGDRTDEYIRAMRSLWTEDIMSFDGDFVKMHNVASNPKPFGTTVPIHIGGHSKRAARRAGELGDGFFPAEGNVAELIDMARQFATDAGRDATAIEMTTSHPGLFGEDPAAAIEELKSWGVSRAGIPAQLFQRSENLTADMAAYVTRLRG